MRVELELFASQMQEEMLERRQKEAEAEQQRYIRQQHPGRNPGLYSGQQPVQQQRQGGQQRLFENEEEQRI